MFKVPEWGDDVPKNNVNFQKTNQVGTPQLLSLNI